VAGHACEIVDEYNRIPTRTQSALLIVIGDNYAEVLGQIYECLPPAWYLTANDDAGGGTYQVIEALRDRIDVVVQALSFNPRFLADLVLRIEENVRPEEVVPREIVFDTAEVDQLGEAARAIPLPSDVRYRIEFFGAQFAAPATGLAGRAAHLRRARERPNQRRRAAATSATPAIVTVRPRPAQPRSGASANAP